MYVDFWPTRLVLTAFIVGSKVFSQEFWGHWVFLCFYLFVFLGVKILLCFKTDGKRVKQILLSNSIYEPYSYILVLLRLDSVSDNHWEWEVFRSFRS